MRAKIQTLSPEMTEAYSDLEYLCYIIAFHAAPTIRRCKASSLVTLKNGKRPLQKLWFLYQDKIADCFPLSFYPLCNRSDSITVLCYYPDLLEECLQKEGKAEYLADFSYHPEMSLEEKLEHLASRYGCQCPHEIGLFLDYPLHDVKDFMECKKNCILTGYWKVYSEESVALRRFEQFDGSRCLILEALRQGVSPKQICG